VIRANVMVTRREEHRRELTKVSEQVGAQIVDQRRA
jgi:hypothetical protein